METEETFPKCVRLKLKHRKTELSSLLVAGLKPGAILPDWCSPHHRVTHFSLLALYFFRSINLPVSNVRDPFPSFSVFYLLIHVYIPLMSGSPPISITNTGKPTDLWFCIFTVLYLCGLYRHPDFVDSGPPAFDVSEFGRFFSYNIWNIIVQRMFSFHSLKYIPSK